MPDGLWPILVLIAMIVAGVLAWVRYYVQLSDRQWRQIDKSKLREWDDEED